MQGGLKVYVGSPAAARAYLEADRGRADDYYLAEGTGIARRYAVTVRELQSWNNMGGSTALRAGQSLTIHVGGGSGADG